MKALAGMLMSHKTQHLKKHVLGVARCMRMTSTLNCICMMLQCSFSRLQKPRGPCNSKQNGVNLMNIPMNYLIVLLGISLACSILSFYRSNTDSQAESDLLAFPLRGLKFCHNVDIVHHDIDIVLSTMPILGFPGSFASSSVVQGCLDPG